MGNNVNKINPAVKFGAWLIVAAILATLAVIMGMMILHVTPGQHHAAPVDYSVIARGHK